MNYVKLMNWFWQEVPYRTGYKSEYGIVFLAIVDLCNRNEWRETSAEYDRMINKAKISKRLYYEALKWLVEQKLIGYQRGYNDYAPAKFSLKVEVQKGDTAATSTAPLPHLCDTSTDTSGVPTAAPIIDKPLNLETDKQIDIEQGLPVVDTTVKRNGNGQMIKPDLTTIEQYFVSHGGTKKMAETMYNFYASKGWKVGRDPMVDWNRAAANWIGRQKEEAAPLNTANPIKQMVY